MEALEYKIKHFLHVGSGSGSGDGSGYGDGSGDGNIKSINGELLYNIDGVATIIRSVHEYCATGVILQSDLTLTHTYIAKVGNFFAHGVTLRDAYTSAQTKALRNEPIEMRIERFKRNYPDYNKKISAMELFKWHNILTGSCEQGRLSFAKDKGINLESDKFTVCEFVAITSNAYGGEIIRKILE